MAEWTPYRVNIPRGAVFAEGDGAVLETVYHVAHVAGARRILEDGRVRAGLIYDESRLNRSRTCVSWVSANRWGLGSIYGNIQFSFAWSELIKDRSFYWVEAMPGYLPLAYRILLTDRDLTNSRYVTPYDPSKDKGPLRKGGGTWYWNGVYTSEFMIDGDLDLDACTAFEFISHHSSICRENGNRCPDRRAQTYQIGGRVLAFLLGHELHGIDHVLKVPSRYDATRSLSDAVDSGIDGIMRVFGNRDDRFRGGIKTQASRQAVLRGALALYGADKKKPALELVALLQSENIFEKALEEIVNAHFGTTGWTIPEDG